MASFGDFFMALFLFFFQVTSPNHVIPECVIGKKSWRLITVPMATPSLNLLREKFSELTRAEPHLGLNPRAPSLEGGVIHKWPCKLTLFGTGGGIFIPLSLLDQILSAEFSSKISKKFWRWKFTLIGTRVILKPCPKMYQKSGQIKEIKALYYTN